MDAAALPNNVHSSRFLTTIGPPTDIRTYNYITLEVKLRNVCGFGYIL